MTEADRRIILSCFANGFEFHKDIEQMKVAEVKTLTGVETFTVEYMNQLASMLCDALDKQAISEKASDKYRWHDLRKDPEDLPNEELFFKNLLVTDGTSYMTDCSVYEDSIYGNISAEREGCIMFNVIAWREIEPFEEEEE